MIYLVRRPHIDEVTFQETTATGWRGRVAEFFRHFGTTVGGISTGPRFIAALVLSVAIWAMQVWTYALTARAVDFNLSLVGTVSALLAVNIGFAIRATPGQRRRVSGALRAHRHRIRHGRQPAIAVAFLIQTQQIIPVTLLGVALAPEFIFKKRKTRAADSGLELHSRAEELVEPAAVTARSGSPRG